MLVGKLSSLGPTEIASFVRLVLLRMRDAE